jgi:hypothetical protein
MFHALLSRIQKLQPGMFFVVLGAMAVVFPITDSCLAAASDNAKPFLGDWDLTLPDGAAGWLNVTEKDGQLQASILWGGGSVVPVNSVKVEGNLLLLTRKLSPPPKKGAASPTQIIAARVDGNTLKLRLAPAKPSTEFTGTRSPAIAPTPNLSALKFGNPIVLFNGKNLDGWKLANAKQINGWGAKDGILVNHPTQDPGKPHKHYGNLRTNREFNDFNLTMEVRVPKSGNSGIYLRGIYEIQVFDSHGKPLDSHNMGAIYSRIAPREAAEKPAGQWQTFDITLVDRHVTVVLNGRKIIDNQPLRGCTGGALWSDQLRPGPICLQGDHTSIEYRNIVLRPVVK